MNVALQAEPPLIIACTISRDVQAFDLLIEDMEISLGERWGDLGFAEALAFLDQPEADALEFVAIALDAKDEADLSLIVDIITAAKAKGIKVILIAEDVSPASLHQLLRKGGDEFVPYPLPEGELARAIARVNEEAPPDAPAAPRPMVKASSDRSGVVIPVYGMAGGTGATTFAVNLAWELAILEKGEAAPRVCILDLSLQSGSVATYLDLPRRESVLEMLSDTESMDNDSFVQAMVPYNTRLQVLTAPPDLVPLDLIGPSDVVRILEAARTNFDYVIIDMPPTIAEWGEAVLNAAHICFATLELDMRSAQNTLRLKRALTGEGLPFDKFRFILNRAPGFADLNGRSRVKRLAQSLGIAIEVQLPDGGRAVAQNADHGIAMAEGIPRNPLRKEIAKLAKSVHDINIADEAKVRAGTPARARA